MGGLNDPFFHRLSIGLLSWIVSGIEMEERNEMIEIPEEDFEQLFRKLFENDSRDYDERWQIIEQLFCQMMGWA